jgi:hypothetical protein
MYDNAVIHGGEETMNTIQKKQKWIIEIVGLLLAHSLFGQIYFYDVGYWTGTQVACNTHGSGFFDYNGDGWDDIYVVHNTSLGGYIDLDNTLLKNLGNQHFQNVTQEAGAAGQRRYSAQGLAAGDYDNDGDIDMCIAMGSNNYLLFYKNNGNGTFTDVSSLISDPLTFAARNLAFIDYNNDGFLDLIFERSGDPANPTPLFLLYKNNYNWNFIDVTPGAGLGNLRAAGGDLFGMAFADIDNDNDIDFYVPRYDANSLLMINNGNGTFSEASAAFKVPQDSYQIGAVFLDYNNDGYWDLFIKRWSPLPARLFRNNGNNTFTDVSTEAGVNVNTGPKDVDAVFGGGLTAGDFNNDGYTDILSINEYGANVMLFRNNGNDTFTDIAYAAGLTEGQYRWYWTAPVADFDHDGYLDIYMARSPGVPTYASLYKSNGGGANKSIRLRLTGDSEHGKSNRSAVGARIEGHLNLNGNEKIQLRQVQGGDSYKVNSFIVHFGIGQAAYMDSVVIRWPSGIEQRLIEVPANNGMPPLDVTEKDTVQYYGDLFIAGETRHVKSERNIGQVEMNMTGDLSISKYSDVNGYYQFKPIDSGTPNLLITPSKPREEDVESWVLTSYDAALVLQYLAGLDTLSRLQKIAADADNSGSIDALDAAYIARYAVGLKNDSRSNSKVGNWTFIPPSRPYTNVIQVFRHEDYQGVVAGDVSENWGNPSGSGKASASAFCPHWIQVSRISETIDVPVSMEEHSGLLSADVWLKYDPSCLDFQAVVKTELTSGFNLEFNEESEGFLKIALYGACPLSEAGTILNVRFLVRNGKQTTIHWEKVACNDQEFRVSESLLGVSETGEGHPKTFGLSGNYPNPFNPGTSVDYELDRAGNVELKIYDIQGREIRSLVHGWRDAGEYKSEWDGKDGLGQDVPTGLYFCRLESGGRVATVKMLKAR